MRLKKLICPLLALALTVSCLCTSANAKEVSSAGET